MFRIFSLILVLFQRAAISCPVCFGNPNHPMVKATNAGVEFLIYVIGGVLIAFIGLFGFWMYRASKLKP